MSDGLKRFSNMSLAVDQQKLAREFLDKYNNVEISLIESANNSHKIEIRNSNTDDKHNIVVYLADEIGDIEVETIGIIANQCFTLYYSGYNPNAFLTNTPNSSLDQFKYFSYINSVMIAILQDPQIYGEFLKLGHKIGILFTDWENKI